MSVLKSTCIWGKEDGVTMEQILSEVGDDSVPRIEEALSLLAKAFSQGADGAIALEPCDSILTDCMRCILSHRWLLPSVQRKDPSGKVVASFFMQPFGSGQVLSLFSSTAAFSKLQKMASEAGARLTPVPFTFGQVIMGHLPNMTREAMKKHGVSETNGVRAISLDPFNLQVDSHDDAGQDYDNLIVFSDMTFPLLRSFCYCYLLAGQVLQLQEDVELGKAKPSDWQEVLCKQSLHAIMTGESGENESVFASEAGMLLFCYPGDAAKVLAYHRRKGTPGLDKGRVVDVDPLRVLHLLRWQAKEDKSSLILAAVMEVSAELQLHGLSITPEMYLKEVEPGLADLSSVQ
eukprot:TRINITY_DN78279_c0_g1_i1.p1 TRINITY_DN78279_c0_g1~~TRINITY_DN78279_c0_g1_i1.p1  ORF type:complete len:347 (+),score=79.22 TRINITY_DN78279_c0_g1_i1:67-1107(+)